MNRHILLAVLITLLVGYVLILFLDFVLEQLP
jgi:hypothetical protein